MSGKDMTCEDMTCENCDRVETCAGNDNNIFPCQDFVSKDCRLLSDKLVLAPEDPEGPPSWAPSQPGVEILWIDRKLFDKLKKLKHEMPCHICPDEIKKKCEVPDEIRDVG